ncbi:STY4851/ECs_5259 family protein [Nioella aestuarii]|uniref:STY4851/ECs_5259 family protein n=1 Tax=Nioella aestuarii TaxID=1662864 RepID=UPI003D7F3256
MKILDEVLDESGGLAAPDGRPLFSYSYSAEAHARLGSILPARLSIGQTLPETSAAFVLWASEHIRADFLGGQLTWSFVFDGLGIAEDRDLAVVLVDRGLKWWLRKVRTTETGIRQYLYSLMSEGGLPQALLRQQGLYNRVVVGFLREIEAEGGTHARGIAPTIAGRYIVSLPQAFHNTDWVKALSEFGMSLVELRERVPEGIEPGLIENWLDENVRDWKKTLPLRLSPEAYEALIRPALKSERTRLVRTDVPIARQLCRGSDGIWRGYVKYAPSGTIPGDLLPEAVGQRLRLVATSGPKGASVSYTASPEEKAWSLRRFGTQQTTSSQLSISETIVFEAYADGRTLGSVVMDPGLPHSLEAPSIWRAADQVEGLAVDTLLPSSGRTQSQALWILTSSDCQPAVSDGLQIGDSQDAEDGQLWPVSGTGIVTVQGLQLRIGTGVEDAEDRARIIPIGDTLTGWRLKDGGPIFLGEPTVLTGIGDAPLRAPDQSSVIVREGRSLGTKVISWSGDAFGVAQMRIVSLPSTTSLVLREMSAGTVELSVDGFPDNWTLALSLGDQVVRQEVGSAPGKLSLTAPGSPIGLIILRLSDPVLGRHLELLAAWPSREGMLLDPSGNRLQDNRPIVPDALRGWRAVVPSGSAGDIQLKLNNEPPSAFRIRGEASLGAMSQLVWLMLAHGGPDAQVDIRLIVGGNEGKRLEVRRYENHAAVRGSILRLGQERDPQRPGDLPQIVIESEEDRAEIIAISLTSDTAPVSARFTVSDIDLSDSLEIDLGPWLLFSRLDGRIQRAAVWVPEERNLGRREDRIAAYVDEWRALVDQPENPNWRRNWQLIQYAADAGDAGVLDQVQALPKVPEAALSLAFRVGSSDLPLVLGLETAAPIYWPATLLEYFQTAMNHFCEFRRTQLRTVFEEAELEEEVDRALTRRVKEIAWLHPELSGHLAMALIQTDRIRLIADMELAARLGPSIRRNARVRLVEVAHEAVRRLDWLPSGLVNIRTLAQIEGLRFNQHAQKLIDAPIVVAEASLGLRQPLKTREILSLINLRLIDPVYFDTALPLAIAYFKETADS